MESMTDWAFSWPISAAVFWVSVLVAFCGCWKERLEVGERGKGERDERVGGGGSYAGSNLRRSAHGFDRCYGPFGRTWSRG